MVDRLTPADFRERAHLEACRYGSDPWVFVRELLQNARDAGARRAFLTTREEGGFAHFVCRDDGGGMTFEHARRFLFALYASSKTDGKSAGRFGVGFWSVLRFAPTKIGIRSWPRHGEAWEVELDGALTRAVRRKPPGSGHRTAHGTEVVLETAPTDTDLARLVRDAAWQSARFLSQRERADLPLEVLVNGVLVTAPFDLPPPSSSFRRGRLRGVVGLGSRARIELFGKGLRVRTASCLDELLSPGAQGSGRPRVPFPDMVEGLAPQALLDSHGLDPLLARGDVRENRALRRLVRLAQGELTRLVERQIAFVRPQPRFRRGIAVGAGLAVAFGLGVWLGSRARSAVAPVRGLPVAPAAGTVAVVPEPRPYRDIGTLYRGPSVDGLERALSPVALRYSPREATPRLRALVVERPEEPWTAPIRDPVGPYSGRPCVTGCVDIELGVSDGPGPLRLLVPTGHRVDPQSVRLGGRAVALFASVADEPVVSLGSATRAVVRYRTGPGAPPAPTPAMPAGRELPATLLAEAARLRDLPEEERVRGATEWVRKTVAYSTAPETVSRHSTLVALGRGLVDRTLEAGAGDCDVQNGVLAVLLRQIGTPARLAVGYVGVDGAAVPWLHAWVEYRAGDGPWRMADASESAPSAPAPAPLPTPLAPQPVQVRAAPTPLGARTAALAAAIPLLDSWSALAATCLASGVAITALSMRRTRRVLRLEARHDLSALLRGALQRPDAFAKVPAVYERRLVPLVGGGALSLGAAWRLAPRGRLLRAEAPSGLALRTARRGAPVVDASKIEGRVVADALGAVDLDAWEAWLARSRSTPLLEALARHLRRYSGGWEVRAADGAGPGLTLELPVRGALMPGSSAWRVIVLDEVQPWLVELERRFAARPAGALFAGMDRVAEHFRLSGARRAALLAPLAREALREAAP